MKQNTTFQEFSKYAILSILGTLGVSCYILADTFFIAKGLGTKGLAALNIALPAYNLIFGIGQMLGMGGATQFSIYKAQKQFKTINLIFTNIMYLAAAFSVVFMLMGLFFSQALAQLLGADAEILEMATTYLKWMLLFGPAFVMNNILLYFVRNDNAPQRAMVAMLVGSFSNIVLDYLFIFPMNMGIFGAILATGLSPVISICMMLPHFLCKHNTFHLVREKLSFCAVKGSLAMGIPTLVSQLSTGFVIIIFNFLILSLEGNTGVAAYGVVANIAFVIIGIYNGIGQGVQPLVGNAHGMGNREKIRKLYGYSMYSMVLISIVIYALIFCFAAPITALFNSENDPNLQEIAVYGLRIYFTSMIAAGYNVIVSVFFTSTERPGPAQLLTLLRGFIVIIPLSFLMAYTLGMTGIWLTYPITEMVVAMIGFVMYHQRKTR